jgi:diaminohydroxyphosphoribosylaminopyrimidine deaminase / 5-amino-6-(5-phosphoribosylamino)uracil reductase
MSEAFAQAVSAKGKTLPNPPVGAVLVKNSKIIAKGNTQCAGGPHAEVMVLRKARGEALGATLYVTLEPCSHHGRTPPCARAVLEAGVTKVVAACPDPNPLVSGKGFAMLRRAGVETEVGLLRERAEEMYGGYFFWIRHGRPRIVLKLAQSLDGRINAASGVETAITGEETRRFTHALRSRADAILVGAATLRADDPDLTPRLTGGSPPEVLVLTRKRLLSGEFKVFSRGRESATVVLSPHANPILPLGAEHFRIPGRRALARELLTAFHERGYHEVLVEGGRGVWAPFLDTGLCDELNIITAPILLPGGERWDGNLRPGWAKPLEFHRFAPLGRDYLAGFRRRDPARATA